MGNVVSRCLWTISRVGSQLITMITPIPPAVMQVDHESSDRAAPPCRHSCISFVEALEESPHETEILVLNDLRKMLQKCSKRERDTHRVPLRVAHRACPGRGCRASAASACASSADCLLVRLQARPLCTWALWQAHKGNRWQGQQACCNMNQAKKNKLQSEHLPQRAAGQ